MESSNRHQNAKYDQIIGVADMPCSLTTQPLTHTAGEKQLHLGNSQATMLIQLAHPQNTCEALRSL